MKLDRRKVTEDKKCSIMEGGIRVDELLSRTVHSNKGGYVGMGRYKERDGAMLGNATNET